MKIIKNRDGATMEDYVAYLDYRYRDKFDEFLSLIGRDHADVPGKNDTNREDDDELQEITEED